MDFTQLLLTIIYQSKTFTYRFKILYDVDVYLKFNSLNRITLTIWRTSLVAQRLKHLPPMRESQVRSLGWEDPLEKEMVTHSSILAWRMPWMEKPGRVQSMGSQRVGRDLSDFTSLHNFTSILFIKHLILLLDNYVFLFISEFLALHVHQDL